MSEKRVACPPPVLLAMVMADDVVSDPATGKLSILGVFDTITASKFPCQHRAIAVYFSLTGGRGAVPATVRLVDVDETRPPVFAVDLIVRFAEPTAWVEHFHKHKGPVFPEPGDYRLQFLAAGELLRELRVKLRLAPKAEQSAGDADR